MQLVEVDTAALRHSVIRICGSDGRTLGSGLSVAPGLVLTCAHVVRQHTDLVLEGVNGIADGVVEVRSASPPTGWTNPAWPFPDLAILRYLADPIGSFALLQDAGFPSQRIDCVTWGFQSREDEVRPEGDPSAFRFTGVSGDGYLALKADVARPGLSGSPLVCPESRAVMGLVAVTRSAVRPSGGWASPISGLTDHRSPQELREHGARLLAENWDAVQRNPEPWSSVLPLQGPPSPSGSGPTAQSLVTVPPLRGDETPRPELPSASRSAR